MGIAAIDSTLLRGALDALAEAVTVTDERGRMLYVNPAAVALLRARSAAELLDAEPGEVMARFAVYDELGRPVPLQRLPGSRLRAGERDVSPILVRNVVRATGEERWLLNKASLVPGDAAKPDRVVNVIEDLTELKRAELSQRLLAEATRELASSLDYERTLQRVAEAVVPALADWCAVMMPAGGTRVQAVAVAHVDPARIAIARELERRYANRLDDGTHLAAILRGEEGSAEMAVPEGALEAFAADREHLRLLEAIGLGAILTVPLDAGGERLGALVLVRTDALRRFGPGDVALAEELAARAATAVLNARLYAERSELASTLQRGMLPPELPAPEGWAAASLYQPAGEIAVVGGDFFDAFGSGDDWIAVIGDVAGHGPESATLAALARWTLRTAGQVTGDPAAAISHLNRTLRDLPQMSLCTAACVLLSGRGDAATATIASCGHPLPLLVRGGEPREVGVAGTLAGAFDDEAWESESVELRAGDALVLYTDGVIDALSHRGRREDVSVAAVLRGPRASARELIDRIDAALAAEPDERRRDDTAAVVLELLTAPVAAQPAAG